MAEEACSPGSVPLRRRWLLTALMFAVGVSICVVLVQELGSQSLQTALWSLAGYLPLLMLIEAGRFAAEMVSARLVLVRAGEPEVSTLLLLRAQCIAHACNKVMPAGRATGEALKAAVLAPVVGTAKAVGVGAAAQIMTLLVNGAVALLAGLVAYLGLGALREATILGLYGLVGTGVGVAVLSSMRSPLLMTWLRRFRWTAGLQHHVDDLLRSGAGFGAGALLWHGMAKVAQALQLGVLLVVLGRGVRFDLSIVAEGVQIVGAAAGDLLPAQLGATESAFTLAASLLGITASAGLSVAVVLHGTQLIFAAIALLAGVLLRTATVYRSYI